MSRLARGVRALTQQEQLNFLLTNRIPRRWATLLFGRIIRIESPWLTRLGLAIWQFFAGDFRLDEAKETRFRSLQDCFTRELRPGRRPIDPDPGVLVSPCDGIVGCHGAIDEITVLQAKGYPYTLRDLLGDGALVERYRNGRYVTLRLRSNMYHRFHAPAAGTIDRTIYFSGDTWNVNPIALKRIERLYCKNERAVMTLDLGEPGDSLAIVAVAAILVASLRLHHLDTDLDLKYRGPNEIACEQPVEKGAELGYFRQGSTIIVLATPGLELDGSVAMGRLVRMGEPLLRKRGIGNRSAL
jgi:phosphatidylserine decarboxylase